MLRAHRPNVPAWRWIAVAWLRAWVLAGLGLTGGVGWAAEVSRPSGSALPVTRKDGNYVTAAVCRECHEEEHASWHRTFHRTMTQVAAPGNVMGSFDGSTVMSDGLAYRVGQEGGAYWAEMPDPDVMMYVVQGGKKIDWAKIPRTRRPVVMTTGSHHYQTYWVSSGRYDRLLQTLPLVYLKEDHRWIPREAAFMRGPGDAGRFVTQWNHHCIRCHSTGGNPGLDDATGMLKTEVGELGISCEACHGPGGDHVRWRRQQATLRPENRSPEPERLIVQPAKLDPRASSQVCGQCHGVYVMQDEFAMDYAHHGPLFRPGDNLDKTRYYIQHPREGSPTERWADLRRNPEFFRERWWDDGTILAGGREYTAMSASACFTKGTMACLSCHAMHGSDPVDQLKDGMTSSKACLQCHGEAKYASDPTQHTHHAVGSSGSDCMNCHMPHTTYALLKGIRSHQIESPRIASSARFGVPNACNLCHLDKTLAWTGEHMMRWYGQGEVALTEDQRTTSAALLWLLKGHAAQRVITAWHLGWAPAQQVSGRDWLAPFQAELLADEYGVVRYVAARGLRSLPGFDAFPFDFLAAPKELRQAAEAAQARWSQQPERPSRRGPEVLIGADGKVLVDRLRALVAAKDSRPVTIKE